MSTPGHEHGNGVLAVPHRGRTRGRGHAMFPARSTRRNPPRPASPGTGNGTGNGGNTQGPERRHRGRAGNGVPGGPSGPAPPGARPGGIRRAGAVRHLGYGARSGARSGRLARSGLGVRVFRGSRWWFCPAVAVTMTDDGCPSRLMPAAPAGLAVRDTAGKDDFGEVAAVERGFIAAVDPGRGGDLAEVVLGVHDDAVGERPSVVAGVCGDHPARCRPCSRSRPGSGGPRCR